MRRYCGTLARLNPGTGHVGAAEAKEVSRERIYIYIYIYTHISVTLSMIVCVYIYIYIYIHTHISIKSSFRGYPKEM